MIEEDAEIRRELAKEKGIKVKTNASFLEFTGYGKFIMTTIVMLIHPAPFFLNLKFTAIKESYYYSDGVFINFSRHFYEYLIIIQIIYSLAMILTIFLETRDFMTHRTHRIAKMGNHKVGVVFALRYYLKKNPIKAPMTLLFFGALFFGSILRISEVGSWNYVLDNPTLFPTDEDKTAAKDEFMVLFGHVNLAWYVFITITTVGYGDIYVKGTLSRFIMYAFGLWGMISLSMIIATFMNLLDVDPDEKRFLKLMNYFRIIKRVTYIYIN